MIIHRGQRPAVSIAVKTGFMELLLQASVGAHVEACGTLYERRWMRRIRLMVIGPPPYLSPAVRQAWNRAGIDLEGPYSSREFASKLVEASFDGAVIDVDYDAPTLLQVVEVLDAFGVPAIFAGCRRAPAAGGYTLSSNPEAINAIVRSLLGSEASTIQ